MTKIMQDDPVVVSRIQHSPLDPSVAGNVAAYEPIAPNVWLGFNNSCAVSLGHGGEASGRPVSYLTMEPRDTNWMSIEAGLDLETLKQTGLASVVLEAAASSSLRVDAVLRMPQKGAGAGFVDTPPQRFILGPQLQEVPVQFFLNADMRAGLGASEAIPKPLVIFFLPLRPVSMSLASLTVTPVPADEESDKNE